MSDAVINVGRKLVGLFLAGLIGVGLMGWGWRASGRQDEPIDFEKAKALQKRVLKGETVSDADRAYIQRAKAAFQKKQALLKQKSLTTPPKDHLDLAPVTDLAGEARYKGEDGGLYGGGRNEPPEAHRKLAMAAAERIRPLDVSGKPSPDGKVVLISVGMSNTTQEFQAFLRIAGPDADRSPSLVMVDGAQNGMVASVWARPEMATRAGRPDPWSVLDQRLEQAGVKAAQVQVAWLKQALPNPAVLGEFPAHAETLKRYEGELIRKLKARFPNLAIIYLSSRIYAGYANTPLNPEPFAYESAYAVRWLIRDQIDGKGDLNADPARGEVKAPVLLWGPYLWADGVKGRKADRLVWERADLGADGTHPSPKGQQKVAALLLDFFKSEPTAKGWFLRHGADGR